MNKETELKDKLYELIGKHPELPIKFLTSTEVNDDWSYNEQFLYKVELAGWGYYDDRTFTDESELIDELSYDNEEWSELTCEEKANEIMEVAIVVTLSNY